MPWTNSDEALELCRKIDRKQLISLIRSYCRKLEDMKCDTLKRDGRSNIYGYSLKWCVVDVTETELLTLNVKLNSIGFRAEIQKPTFGGVRRYLKIYKIMEK